MPIEIGQVQAIFRYPAKSIGGERLEEADMGWHGLEGDRRLSFRRMNDRGGFPRLTTSNLPELIRLVSHSAPVHMRKSGRNEPCTFLHRPVARPVHFRGWRGISSSSLQPLVASERSFQVAPASPQRFDGTWEATHDGKVITVLRLHT